MNKSNLFVMNTTNIALDTLHQNWSNDLVLDHKFEYSFSIVSSDVGIYIYNGEM